MKRGKIGEKIAIGAFVCLLLAGCTTDVYEPTLEPKPKPIPEVPKDSVFDFSMESTYDLKIKYDVPEGCRVPFFVYAENPLSIDEYGNIILKEEVKWVDAGFTDLTGAYLEKIKRSTITDKLYIYTSFPSLPMLMVATINGKSISDPEEVDLTSKVETKSVLRGATSLSGKLAHLHTLGGWKGNGRPDYLLPEKISISKEALNTINKILPEPKPTPEIDNYLIEGDIHVTEKAHLDIYIVSTTTGAHNLFGYYCYPTGNPPKDANEIEDVTMIFPNSIVNPNIVKRGEGVRLHYYEKGIDKGTEFPAGVSIGWVIYNDAFGLNPSLSKYNGKPIYSTSTLNAKREKFMASFQINGFVVIGFEDWTNQLKDYNDLVFHIEADPVDAITDNIPEVKPEPPVTGTATVDYEGLLAFEDLWPRQGDFDMNDVILRYKSVVTYNHENRIVKLEDTFKLLWTGATIRNGFGYQLNGVSRTDIGVEGASLDNSQRMAVIRVFDDALAETAHNTQTPEYTVTTTFFGDGYEKDPMILPPYNPYITPSLDKEVHLTLYPPTEKAKESYFGTDDDESVYGKGPYYVTYSKENGEQMPFAIHIPGSVEDFVVPAESKSIDSYYPGFLNWIQTQGEESKDWYLHPADENPKIPVE